MSASRRFLLSAEESGVIRCPFDALISVHDSSVRRWFRFAKALCLRFSHPSMLTRNASWRSRVDVVAGTPTFVESRIWRSIAAQVQCMARRDRTMIVLHTPEATVSHKALPVPSWW
ncbi:hypothetical protein DOTSEDRAFT_71633 [Dothistroma septosporum NZE10]|uniref:Uncharacterized protein n=1 Tax=Dothistroma septosporum (strain NZE10 / CBS 128990) TaxID=675120 RepID=N1PKL3_DOTSN|nr:hypothetical protein DOTSEDRAFT_71633 [Dothistroma septosporum NZE10]